jgi:hypothetical protein
MAFIMLIISFLAFLCAGYQKDIVSLYVVTFMFANSITMLLEARYLSVLFSTLSSTYLFLFIITYTPLSQHYMFLLMINIVIVIYTICEIVYKKVTFAKVTSDTVNAP